MSIAAASIAGTANIVGLAGVDRIYGKETSAFIDQAIAQDTVSLAVVCPAIVVLALLARRGNLAAHLAWLGTLAFTVYNYVIYTVSIHVGPLFLPWIAVLGLSLYALIGGSAVLDPHAVAARFRHPRTTLAGWFLIIIAALFAALWLRDLIPSIASGQVPAGARELALPSNPVHVLDLSFYLPAATVAGIQLVRRQPLGYLIGPGMLVFLGLTGLPILLTPFIADAPARAPAGRCWRPWLPSSSRASGSPRVCSEPLDGRPAHHPTGKVTRRGHDLCRRHETCTWVERYGLSACSKARVRGGLETPLPVPPRCG